MKYRPILMNGAMVRAVLEGRKTQTRRIVKKKNGPIFCDNCMGFFAVHDEGLKCPYCRATMHCPYGQPGDRLWVREAWRIGAWNEINGAFAIDYCDGPRNEWLVPFATASEEPYEVFERIWIDCCDELIRKRVHVNDDGQYQWRKGESPLRWRPSIHMPRWASRITLEITGVRVERLQDISNKDIRAEGACTIASVTHRLDFEELWETINGEGSWEANPWVWVIEFKVVQP